MQGVSVWLVCWYLNECAQKVTGCFVGGWWMVCCITGSVATYGCCCRCRYSKTLCQISLNLLFLLVLRTQEYNWWRWILLKKTVCNLFHLYMERWVMISSSTLPGPSHRQPMASDKRPNHGYWLRLSGNNKNYTAGHTCTDLGSFDPMIRWNSPAGQQSDHPVLLKSSLEETRDCILKHYHDDVERVTHTRRISGDKVLHSC